jgi:hypothetical protein
MREAKATLGYIIPVDGTFTFIFIPLLISMWRDSCNFELTSLVIQKASHLWLCPF